MHLLIMSVAQYAHARHLHLFKCISNIKICQQTLKNFKIQSHQFIWAWMVKKIRDLKSHVWSKKVCVFHNLLCTFCTKNVLYERQLEAKKNLEENDNIKIFHFWPPFFYCFNGKQEGCVDIHRENPRILYGSHFSLSFYLLHNYTRKHSLVL